MKEFRLIISLIFIPFILLGLAVMFLFGIPFILVGGRDAGKIFDSIMDLVRD